MLIFVSFNEDAESSVMKEQPVVNAKDMTATDVYANYSMGTKVLLSPAFYSAWSVGMLVGGLSLLFNKTARNTVAEKPALSSKQSMSHTVASFAGLPLTLLKSLAPGVVGSIAGNLSSIWLGAALVVDLFPTKSGKNHAAAIKAGYRFGKEDCAYSFSRWKLKREKVTSTTHP